MGLFSHIALRGTICFQNYCDCSESKHSGYQELIADLKPGKVSNSLHPGDRMHFFTATSLQFDCNKIVAIIQATDYRALTILGQVPPPPTSLAPCEITCDPCRSWEMQVCGSKCPCCPAKYSERASSSLAN